VPADLGRFFDAVKAQTKDTRFDDPEYLAAKFVVWQAGENAYNPEHPLDFLSIGVASGLHGDEEYEYQVICNDEISEIPIVEWRELPDDRWVRAHCDGTDTSEMAKPEEDEEALVKRAGIAYHHLMESLKNTDLDIDPETRELLREAADAISTTWAERMAHASREGIPDAIVQVEVDNAAPLRALATRILELLRRGG
jgi:hypothetical protein